MSSKIDIHVLLTYLLVDSKAIGLSMTDTTRTIDRIQMMTITIDLQRSGILPSVGETEWALGVARMRIAKLLRPCQSLLTSLEASSTLRDLKTVDNSSQELRAT